MISLALIIVNGLSALATNRLREWMLAPRMMRKTKREQHTNLTKMTIQEKIRKLRTRRRWSQAELAERLGVSTGHVSRLENGRYQPSIELLKKLAAELQVSTDFLLDDEAGDFKPVNLENRPLAQRIEMLESLDPDEKDAVIKIIDGLLTKKKFLDLVAKESAAAAS